MPEADNDQPPRIQYKPRPLLEPGDQLWKQMLAIGMLNVSQPEAAAMLGVSTSTLQEFWRGNPEFREEYDRGKELRKVKFRKMGDMHAVNDAPTWRFFAKNELGMSDDPSKARLDETTAMATKYAVNAAEARRRIAELQSKVIEGSVSREREKPREIKASPKDQGAAAQRGRQEGSPQPQADAAGTEQVDGDPGVPERAGAHQAVKVHPAGRHAAPKGQRYLPEDPSPPIDPTTPGGVSAVARLQERLAELEASAVRKNPRKDGAPHTDRTKTPKDPVDSAANRRQDRAGMPGRLPGRLGKL